MGCGASAHVQGASPLPAGPEQEAGKGATSNKNPAPIAEDLQAVKDPQVKGVEPAGTAQPAAGGPTAAGADTPPPQVTNRTSQPTPPDGGGDEVMSSFPSVSASGRSETTPVEPLQVQPSMSQSQSQLPPLPRRAAPAAQQWQQQQQQQYPNHPPPLLQQQQQRPDSPSTSANGVCSSPDTTRLVLGGSITASCSVDLDRTTPTPTSLTVGLSSNALDPAVTPSSETTTVTLLPDAPAGFVAHSRYMDDSDLSINSHSYDLDGQGNDSDDDDEVAALFTLQAWKRYYNYNKKKRSDLLSYFWRRFPPEDYSCFCISYRNQELFVTPYMAENCIHGYCARLDDLGLVGELFLQMYVLQDPEMEQYLIVGLLLVPGQSLPSPLAALSAFDGFIYHRADMTRMPVKQFVSALLLGISPLYSLKLVIGREML